MVGAIFDGTRLPGPEVFSKNQKIVDINVEKWTEKVTVVKVTLLVPRRVLRFAVVEAQAQKTQRHKGRLPLKLRLPHKSHEAAGHEAEK